MGFQNNNSHNSNRPRFNSQNGNKYHGGNGNRHNQNNNSNKVFTHFATAPYNFVSYDNQNLLGPSSDKELYSGTIECSLKALTPLLVASSTEKTDKLVLSKLFLYKPLFDLCIQKDAKQNHFYKFLLDSLQLK